MYKIVLAFIFVIIIPFGAFSQELKDAQTRIDNGEDLKVIYRNSASGGVYVHSAVGIGVSFRRGRQVHAKRKYMYEVDASNYKHAKEVKSFNSNVSSSKGYLFGKVNSILLFRGGVGFQNTLFQKTNKKNVQIRYSTFLGGVLALAKPVYLDYRYFDVVNKVETIETKRFDPYHPDQANIVGKSNFFEGIGRTKVVPGVYAKFGLSFEYGDRYNKIKAIEVGTIADFYPTGLEIMARNRNQYLFMSLYIKMVFGKKWF